MVRVDLRTVTMDVPTQDVISRDNVSVKVNAVVYFRVVDPRGRSSRSRTSLWPPASWPRPHCARCSASTSSTRCWPSANNSIMTSRQILDEQTDAWGIKVANVEIKHVDLDESMIRAIARQAEAERERRAKVIHAEGELQASEKLLAATEVLTRNPVTIQLRYLQTLSEVSNSKGSTIVFPFPVELTDLLKRHAASD